MVVRKMHAGAAANPHQAIGMFDANTLEKRIMSLMTPQPSVGRGRKMILLASGILLLSLSGVAAVALTANAEELAKAGPQQAAVQGSPQPIGTPVQSPSQNPPETTPPQLIYVIDPEYPKGETKEGGVVVGCIVDTNGLPQQVHVARSLAPDFDKNAIAAVE